MKILHYYWASYLEDDIFDTYKELSISYDTFSWDFKDKNYDESFLYYFSQTIDLSKYDFLFSINYWPLLSTVCQKANIPYVSWSYDNPLNVREIEKTLGNSVNQVYLFDRQQYLQYKIMGFDTVYHLPLAVNAKRLSKLSVSDEQYNKYHSEVSFVGKLYESATQQLMSMSDDYIKGYLQSVINCQQNLYGTYLIDSSIDISLIERMNHYFNDKYPQSNLHIEKKELTYALACEVTRRDRIVLLSLCGNRFKTKFYSYNNSSIITGVEKLPSVDYKTEMPYIFASSKINLNPCLRAIQTGIPLRAFDIMGCGGFLLSNYQEELYETFIHEKELILYDSLEDAIDKIDFFLKHESQRSSIAANGRQKVLEEHNLILRMKYIISKAINQ